MAVADLLDRAQQKIGPLPAWMWAAIPAGAYVIWSYMNRGTEGIVEDGVPGEEDFLDTGGYPFIPGYDSAPDGSPNFPPPDPPEFTNKDWERQAISWGLSHGHGPSVIIPAVTAYLYGAPAKVNSGQRTALDQVIAALGPAPEGGTYPPLISKPPPKPPPKKDDPKIPAIKGLKMTAEIGTGKVIMQWSRLTGNYRYEYNIAAPGEGWKKDKITPGVRVVESRKLSPGKVFNGRVRAVGPKGVRGQWSTTSVRATK